MVRDIISEWRTWSHLGVCIGRWLFLVDELKRRPSKSPESETTTVPVAFSPSSLLGMSVIRIGDKGGSSGCVTEDDVPPSVS